MKFSEKLVQLRKQNKLSQEQLADMLDVSRQAVSKWESGTTYPEMDKLLTMCKLFKCSLDELTNDEISTRDFGEKKKSNFIIDALDMIAKTFEMFRAMNIKQVISCVLSMLLLYFILWLLFIPINKIIDLGNEIIYFFGPARLFFSVVWAFLIKGAYLVVATVIFIYIFKVRYLDRFEYVPKSIKTNDKKDNDNEDVVIKETRGEKVQPQVIYYRESKTNNFFKTFSNLAIIFIKALFILLLIPFIIAFLVLFAILIVNIILMFNGVIYIGIFLGIIFGIILDYIIIELGYDFLFNRKVTLKRIFIMFIVGLAGFGIAIGSSIYEISTTKYIEEAPVSASDTATHIVKMTDGLLFSTYGSYAYDDKIHYEADESLTDEVQIIIHYNADFTSNNVILSDRQYKGLEHYMIGSWETSSNGFQKIWMDFIINDLKHHQIHDYDRLYWVDITIKTSQGNINKLKENLKKYYDREEEYYANINLETELENSRNAYEDLEEKYNELSNEKEELTEELNNTTINYNSCEQKVIDYEEKIEEYKNKINNLIEE